MNTWKMADGAQVAGVTSGNIQSIGEELYRLAKKHRTLESQMIVAAAKAKASPLHAVIFRLDDPAAAAEHRLFIARNLIKGVRIVTENGEETLEQRVFVNVVTDATRGYQLIPTVMQDATLREQVLMKAKADLEAWRDRYRELQELSEVFAVIDRTLAAPVKPPKRSMRPMRHQRASASIHAQG